MKLNILKNSKRILFTIFLFTKSQIKKLIMYNLVLLYEKKTSIYGGKQKSKWGRLSMFDFIIVFFPNQINLYINLKEFNNFL